MGPCMGHATGRPRLKGAQKPSELAGGVGIEAREAGFTLFELLVVLVILVAVLAITVPSLSRGQGAEIKATARTLAAGLRQARSHLVVR